MRELINHRFCFQSLAHEKAVVIERNLKKNSKAFFAKRNMRKIMAIVFLRKAKALIDPNQKESDRLQAIILLHSKHRKPKQQLSLEKARYVDFVTRHKVFSVDYFSNPINLVNALNELKRAKLLIVQYEPNTRIVQNVLLKIGRYDYSSLNELFVNRKKYTAFAAKLFKRFKELNTITIRNADNQTPTTYKGICLIPLISYWELIMGVPMYFQKNEQFATKKQ